MTSTETIEFAIVVPPLTDAGLTWALDHAESSITARVAIAPSWDTEWPAAHRRMAVAICNGEGMKAASL